MAIVERKLNMTAAAYIDSRTPDAVGPLAKGSQVKMHWNDDAGENCRLFIGFEAFPVSLKRKKLINIRQIGVKCLDSGSIFGQASLGSWSANTLTWNNRPSTKGNQLYYTAYNLGYKDSGWDEHPSAPSTIEKSTLSKDVLKYSTIVLYPGQRNSEKDVTLYGYIRDTSVYDALPWVLVEYDDGADLKSQITPLNNKSGYLNPKTAQTFTWDFLSADANYVCAGDFAQASATFFWKEHSAESYTSVSASGGTQSVTIPANTFPLLSNIISIHSPRTGRD